MWHEGENMTYEDLIIFREGAEVCAPMTDS